MAQEKDVQLPNIPLHDGLQTYSAWQIINLFTLTPIEFLDMVNGKEFYDDSHCLVCQRLVTTEEFEFRQYTAGEYFDKKDLENIKVYKKDLLCFCQVWGFDDVLQLIKSTNKNDNIKSTDTVDKAYKYDFNNEIHDTVTDTGSLPIPEDTKNNYEKIIVEKDNLIAELEAQISKSKEIISAIQKQLDTKNETEELSKKRRQSYLKIIIAMANMQTGIDLKEFGIQTTIAETIRGMNFSISNTTVGSILTEAQEYLENPLK